MISLLLSKRNTLDIKLIFSFQTGDTLWPITLRTSLISYKSKMVKYPSLFTFLKLFDPLPIHFHLSVSVMEMRASCVLLLMGYAFICGIHGAHVCSERSCFSHPAQQMRVVSRCVFSFGAALILQQASSVRLELFKPIKGSSWPVNIKYACCFGLVRLDMRVMDGCCMETQCRALKGFFLLVALI